MADAVAAVVAVVAGGGERVPRLPVAVDRRRLLHYRFNYLRPLIYGLLGDGWL
jgi:hypothetical protein